MAKRYRVQVWNPDKEKFTNRTYHDNVNEAYDSAHDYSESDGIDNVRIFDNETDGTISFEDGAFKDAPATRYVIRFKYAGVWQVGQTGDDLADMIEKAESVAKTHQFVYVAPADSDSEDNESIIWKSY